MADANVFTTSWDRDEQGARSAGVARRAGAEQLGASVYELEPGARWADLHFHHAIEELIVVLEGTPTLYTFDGSRELGRGEVVACLSGRRGAHRLENLSDETARVLIVSTMQMPDIVEYPERATVFVMTEPPYTDKPLDEERGRLLRLFRLADGRPVPPDE